MGSERLAVASAVGAFGQALAESFDFADVGFTLVSVPGDGDVGRRGVKAEADHLSFEVPAGQSEHPRAALSRPVYVELGQVPGCTRPTRDQAADDQRRDRQCAAVGKARSLVRGGPGRPYRCYLVTRPALAQVRLLL